MSKMHAALRVQGISKEYVLGGIPNRHDTLYDLLADTLKSPLRRLKTLSGRVDTNERFWALKDVSFEVAPGEVLGIIGRNGAGKSTLLKVLSRITAPTSGRVDIRGRVGSLLEVGTGFHPELTGRENIFLNGAILGMKRREVAAKLDEIAAFAEVEKFLDTPVKRYSSGMYVRLAFSVAASLEVDILVVDEVLAVGDASFQKKCLAKMSDVGNEGRTVLFVSHNMGSIQGLCQRALLLDEGAVRYQGGVRETIERYVSQSAARETSTVSERSDRKGNGRARVTGMKVVGMNSGTDTLQVGDDLCVELTFQAKARLRELCVQLVVDTLFGDHMLFLGTDLVGRNFEEAPTKGTVVCRVPRLALMPAQYALTVYVVANGYLADQITDAVRFHVLEGDFHGHGRLPPAGYAKLLVDHDWRLDSADRRRNAGGTWAGRKGQP